MSTSDISHLSADVQNAIVLEQARNLLDEITSNVLTLPVSDSMLLTPLLDLAKRLEYLQSTLLDAAWPECVEG